jgi:hypothetical protein
MKMLTPEKDEAIKKVVCEVATEVVRASMMFEPMNSPHEAHSVIEEEFDEYWDEVKAYNPRKNRDTRPRQREELIQLAAMAVRAIVDTVDFGKHYEAQPCRQPQVH